MSDRVLLCLPVLVPFATATLALLAWRRPVWQRRLGVLGAALLLASTLLVFLRVVEHGPIATQIGGWSAPFGITLVADLFSAIMLLLPGVMGFLVAIYATATLDPERERHNFYPLYHVLLMGVSAAFLTGDLFNLYVCFEIMLIASFVLLTLGGERSQLEGAVKYVTLNLMSSGLFLAAVGILYGVVGTLNMADIAVKLRDAQPEGIVTGVAMMFLVAFGIKAALFPLFFWLPASYHTPPPAISAIFAALLTKVGIYSLIRAFTLMFSTTFDVIGPVILVLACFTMVVGVLGAAAQMEVRRILSFHSVSQVGYMTFGLGLMTPLGLAGTMYFAMHHALIKPCLFLLSGLIKHYGGSYELTKLGGLQKRVPVLAVLFLGAALALAGIPPLSGFFAKFALIKAAFDGGHYGASAVALTVSVLTLLSMTKIWSEAFWKDAPEDPPAPDPSEGSPLGRQPGWLAWLPIATLVALSLAMGVFAGPLLELTLDAAKQLLEPAGYIQTVLNTQAGP